MSPNISILLRVTIQPVFLPSLSPPSPERLRLRCNLQGLAWNFGAGSGSIPRTYRKMNDLIESKHIFIKMTPLPYRFV